MTPQAEASLAAAYAAVLGIGEGRDNRGADTECPSRPPATTPDGWPKGQPHPKRKGSLALLL
jgi:hypothetical protein